MTFKRPVTGAEDSRPVPDSLFAMLESIVRTAYEPVTVPFTEFSISNLGRPGYSKASGTRLVILGDRTQSKDSHYARIAHVALPQYEVVTQLEVTKALDATDIYCAHMAARNVAKALECQQLHINPSANKMVREYLMRGVANDCLSHVREDDFFIDRLDKEPCLPPNPRVLP